MPADSVLFGVGGTVRNSDNMINASVSFALNKGKNVGMSKAAMAKEISALKKENADMKQVVMAMAQKLDSLTLVSNKQAGFSDVPDSHWANEAVSTLHGNGFVQGYPDGEFKGDRLMTRYEYAEMLYKALSKGARVDPEVLREYAPELRRVEETLMDTSNEVVEEPVAETVADASSESVEELAADTSEEPVDETTVESADQAE